MASSCPWRICEPEVTLTLTLTLTLTSSCRWRTCEREAPACTTPNPNPDPSPYTARLAFPPANPYPKPNSNPNQGASLHDGRTWHGSGPNDSAAAPRRGLGIHFVPACATFAPGAELGKLWAPLKQPGTDALPDDLLPVTWVPSQQVPSQQVEVPSQVPSGGEVAVPPSEAGASVTAALASLEVSSDV